MEPEVVTAVKWVALAVVAGPILAAIIVCLAIWLGLSRFSNVINKLFIMLDSLNQKVATQTKHIDALLVVNRRTAERVIKDTGGNSADIEILQEEVSGVLSKGRSKNEPPKRKGEK